MRRLISWLRHVRRNDRKQALDYYQRLDYAKSKQAALEDQLASYEKALAYSQVQIAQQAEQLAAYHEVAKERDKYKLLLKAALEAAR